MAIDKVKTYFRECGIGDRVLEFEVSSATVELVAAAVGCEPARIANDALVSRGRSGGARRSRRMSLGMHNQKFKAQLGTKATVLSGVAG